MCDKIENNRLQQRWGRQEGLNERSRESKREIGRENVGKFSVFFQAIEGVRVCICIGLCNFVAYGYILYYLCNVYKCKVDYSIH